MSPSAARVEQLLEELRALARRGETFETVLGAVIGMRPGWSVVEEARDTALRAASNDPDDEEADRVASWLTLVVQLGLFRRPEPQ